jgi:hypothetical protein
MADNTTLNAGTGGDVIASDDIGGVKFQRIKLIHGADGSNAGDVAAANPLPVAPSGAAASYWPGYSGPSDAGPRDMSVDDGGALVTRGAVTTDEGTFRCNFANTAYALGIGSVTVSGAVVTGTGFMLADLHHKDYFKIAADADAAWVQIQSIDSDTQLTLVAAYVGSASGTGNRSLVRPAIGSGGSLAVASGQLTIASGTTANAVTGVYRFCDYAPLVYRSRASISQRIVNQAVHLGLEEDVSAPRYFARFVADGTTNTTIKCETGRNPTGVPSASETETTTVTMTNGGTTATQRDYRIEVLTEVVRFYIDGVRVAEHSRSIPAQHDEMAAHVEIINGGTSPASTTSVVVDFMAGKNHNKIEVGIMSESEQIVAVLPPMAQFSYSVAGVIAINTDLLVIDCLQLRGLLIHSISMGTSGVVTGQWSSTPDFANVITATLYDQAGVSSTTFNAGTLVRSTNVHARYFRLRLTTATTAGTTTINVVGTAAPVAPVVATQPISGTVTANIGTGSLAAGTNAIGDFGIQYRANATGAAGGAHIVSAATTNATIVKASAGRLLGWNLANPSAAWKYVKFHNQATSPTAGTGVVRTIGIPPGGRAEMSIEGGIAFTTGIGMTIVSDAADAGTTAVALADVVGDVFFA